MDEIHVSWRGSQKPAPRDLAKLLSVRRRVVEKALVWLKRHNPLYASIEIDMAEMESWEAPSYGVPCQVYDRMERNEPSAREKTRTAHVVPPTERGLENNDAMDLQEIFASIEETGAISEGGQNEDLADADEDMEVADGSEDSIHEIDASGMFGLDCQPNIADAEKLRDLCAAMGESVAGGQISGGGGTASAEVRHGGAVEPYILLSRGEEFADAFDVRFFAKVFPVFFPVGG